MRTHRTKNDLPESTRKPLINLLNANLANAIDLALQSKQAHWNVKGPDFIQLHELFDQVYAEATAWVDLIAERAVILGGVAVGPVQSVAEKTELPAYSIELSAGRDHVDALSGALSAFGKSIRAAIESAESHGDADTADLFTEVSRGADKMLWFVEAHLQSDR